MTSNRRQEAPFLEAVVQLDRRGGRHRSELLEQRDLPLFELRVLAPGSSFYDTRVQGRPAHLRAGDARQLAREPVWCPWVRRISLRKRRAREPLQRRVTTDPGVGQHCGQVESNPPVNVRAAGRPAQLDQSS